MIPNTNCHKQIGRVRSRNDRLDYKRLQQFVSKLAGQHEVQCLLDLPTKLLSFTISFVVTRTTLEETARVDTVVFLNFSAAREHLLALSIVEWHKALTKEWR